MWKGRRTAPWRHKAEDDHPHRRGKRHRIDSLSCDLGTVRDLSTVGMRVAVDGRPPLHVGQSGKIKLRIPEGALSVTGRVVWSRRVGFRRYEMGIEFVNVKRNVTAALDLLGRFGFLGVGDAAAEEPAPTSRRPAQKVRASIDLPDYYKILGVNSKATDEEIREAFRSLARQHHPDVSDDPGSAERFMQVHEAYEILRDEARRKQYDLKLAG